jgi:ribose transport system substrate-binding protein
MRSQRSGVIVALTLAATALASAGAVASDPSPGASAAASGDVVQEAIAAVQAATGPTDQWYGPTSGPTPQAGKSVVCVNYYAQDVVGVAWCDGVEEAAAAIGWTETTIDTVGTPDSWRSGMQQAIALNPDGIVISLDGNSVSGLLQEAADAGITVIGIHSSGTPGPHPELNLFTNLSYDPAAQAKLAAQSAIADSNGTAQMIEITDDEYAIAKTKATTAMNTIEACPTCKNLEYVSTPVGQANQNMPGLFTSWITKYPDPFYVFSVSDAGFLDPGIPALRTGGVPTTGRIALIGSDGSPSAYQRIQSGEYQIATIPEPAGLQGWQAVDELNRAFNGMEPSGTVWPLHIITTDNFATSIVDGVYVPQVDYASEYAKLWGIQQ